MTDTSGAASTSTGAVPPGWYTDPRDAGQARYWDGADWTDHVAPIPAGAVLVSGGRPVEVEPAGPPGPRRVWRWALGLAAVVVLGAGGWLLWPDPEPPTPSTTLLTAGGIGQAGRIEAFSVEDGWRVEFRFGDGAPDGAFAECSLRGEVRRPDGSPSGLPGFGAGDDPVNTPGRGSGAQSYDRGGTFVITLAIPCAQSTDGAPMPWSVRIVN